MFTSRAEHRLLLRNDNADLRLTPLARQTGLVDAERWAACQKRQAEIDSLRTFTHATRFGEGRLSQWIRRPETSWSDLPAELRSAFSPEAWEAVETDLRYEGYITRQHAAVEKLRSQDAKPFPPDLDFSRIRSLRVEARQKLSQLRPATLGQAGRISGVTPSDLALLSLLIERPKTTWHDLPPTPCHTPSPGEPLSAPFPPPETP
jgi:tRNA uridine 5-carboxymethylaminomethyl modification enzyme